jgi:aspartate kinase
VNVLKFGGTSVGSVAAVARVVEIVAGRRGQPVVLVFSAVGDTTDRLEEIGQLAAAGRLAEALHTVERLRQRHLELAHRTCADGVRRRQADSAWTLLFERLRDLAGEAFELGELPPSLHAQLLGLGELVSTHLMVAVLRAAGVPATWVDARELVVTDSDHLEGEPVMAATTDRCRARLLPLLAAGELPVTQGFIARSVAGADTTLGRGGSDLTATLIGAALGAREVEIWTDVDGVMTADPRLVAMARRLPELSYDEASALALYGARVLHPRTLGPAVPDGIPVRVRNTLRPDGEGTVIHGAPASGGSPVRSIASRTGISRIDLKFNGWGRSDRVLEGVFAVIRRHRLSPAVVAVSEVAASVAVARLENRPRLVEELAAWGAVTVTPDQAVVGVVGPRLRHRPAVMARLFEALERVPVGLVSLGGCEHSLGFLIDEAEHEAVVRRLHRRLVEAEVPGGLALAPRAAAMRA